MRLSDLITELEQIALEYGDDINIRLAVNPEEPTQHHIGAIVYDEGDEALWITESAMRDESHIPDDIRSQIWG